MGAICFPYSLSNQHYEAQIVFSLETASYVTKAHARDEKECATTDEKMCCEATPASTRVLGKYNWLHIPRSGRTLTALGEMYVRISRFNKSVILIYLFFFFNC